MLQNLGKRPIRSVAELTRNQRGDFAELLRQHAFERGITGAPSVALPQQVFLRQGELH
jgi:hypothetical protein